METQLTLDQFLKQEEQAGDLDSSGEFSISLEDAVSKMVEYRYAEPHCFLLRILQSAAVVGGRDVVIDTSVDRRGWERCRLALNIKFFVDEPGRYGELSTLVGGFTTVEHSKSADGYLTAGLQAAIPLMSEGFQWFQLRGAKKETLFWGNDGCQVARKFTAHASDMESEFRFLQYRPPHKKVGFFQDFASLMRMPQPPIVDFRVLPARLITLPLDYSLHWNLSVLPEIKRLGGSEVPKLLKLAPKKIFDVGIRVEPNSERAVYLDLQGQRIYELPKKKFQRASHYLQASTDHSNLKINWVEAGVVIDTEELPWDKNLGVDAWVTTTDLQNDLSGFKVVQNEAYQEKVAEINRMAEEHLKPLYEEWMPQLDSGYRDSDLL